MTQPHDHEAGYKHRSTDKFLEHFKKEVMDMCLHTERIYGSAVRTGKTGKDK